MQLQLHGRLLSNFTLGSVGRVLEGVADFAQMKSSDMTVALVVPFRRATSERKNLVFLFRSPRLMKILIQE